MSICQKFVYFIKFFYLFFKNFDFEIVELQKFQNNEEMNDFKDKNLANTGIFIILDYVNFFNLAFKSFSEFEISSLNFLFNFFFNKHYLLSLIFVQFIRLMMHFSYWFFFNVFFFSF